MFRGCRELGCAIGGGVGVGAAEGSSAAVLGGRLDTGLGGGIGGGAPHGFTQAGNYFNANAARRSWVAMQSFFKETIAK